MLDNGWPLYLLLGALLFYFWTRVRGMTFDEMIDRQLDVHLAVHKVLHKHPKGGTFEDFNRWLGGKL